MVPDEFIVSSGTIAVSSIETMNNQSSVPAYNANTRTITIKNAFSTSYPSSTVVSFSITSGIANSKTVVTTSTGFTIQTLDSLGKIIG